MDPEHVYLAKGLTETAFTTPSPWVVFFRWYK